MLSTLALVTFTASIRSLHAECNLLESGNAAYIDTESEAALLTMCSGDTAALSLWEQYQCDFMIGRSEWQRCWPQRRMSNCAPGELKGAAFLYHGYSACPDQYNAFAPKLQDACYDVYQILTIGHGYDYCSSNTSDSGCTAEMYNLTAMPNTRAPYLEYIERMVAAITEEVSIIKECETAANSLFDADAMEVVVGGLSFGAPLTAATVAMSGADSVFTKQILMSPFFGVTYGGLDDLVYKCLLNAAAFTDCLPVWFAGFGLGDEEIAEDDADNLSEVVGDALASYVDLERLDNSFETFNLMIRKVLRYIVEDPDALGDGETAENVQNLLDTVMGWGAQCELDILERGRGGFCQFTIRNLVASHSFADYISNLELTTDVDPSIETLLVLVERDGPTRNSLAVNYVNLFYGHDGAVISSQAQMCDWFIAQECQTNDFDGAINNECGVPHSSMANADNEGIPPNFLPWNETYHEGLIDWMQNGNADSVENFLVSSRWDGGMLQCVALDLNDPPSSLIADVPSLMKIGVRVVGGDAIDAVQNALLDAISQTTGVPRGVLELTTSLLSNDDDDTEGDYYEFSMSLDSDGGDIMEVLLENDAVAQLANFTVDLVELNGVEYEPMIETTATPETTEDEGNGAKTFGAGAWLAVVGAAAMWAM